MGNMGPCRPIAIEKCASFVVLSASLGRWTIAAAVAGFVAALAALVAAWPVVKEWLPR
jgi:hypothetical protein